MTNENKPNENDEDLRFENELLKLKIMAEHGATKVTVLPGKDVPPEVENEMLKFFASCDDDTDDIEEIPIYDFIGRPDFVKEEDLSDELLPTELERLNDLLYEKNIIYSVLASVEDRLVYKFVTEDLFQHLILNIDDSDVGSHYFYEDFHPNHEYDTREACEEFMNAFFNSNVISTEDDDYATDLVRNFDELCKFHEAFEEFRNVEYEFFDAAVIPGECIRKATISFDAVTSVGLKPIHYSGEATFLVGYIEEFWTVVSAVFPGMTEAGE